MDKETLIRLATPLSITLLAISITTYPLLTNAYGEYDKGGKYFPLHVKLVNQQRIFCISEQVFTEKEVSPSGTRFDLMSPQKNGEGVS